MTFLAEEPAEATDFATEVKHPYTRHEGSGHKTSNGHVGDISMHNDIALSCDLAL